MKKTKLAIKILSLLSLVIGGTLFSGCAAGISKYNTAALGAPAGPPSGKALVCIHRPKGRAGRDLFAPVWVDKQFIADLGNGYSVGCVCEPGQHYLLCLSAEETSCVQAQLLADQSYDLWLDNSYGFWVPSFKLKPIHKDDKFRTKIAKWTKRNGWVEPAAAGTDFENVKKENLGPEIMGAGAIGMSEGMRLVSPEKLQSLVEEFTSGKRKDKLQQLAPDDHR